MDKIQNFQKGINKDISPVYQPEGSYVDALNIEVINDELQGSLSISNSQGNKLQLNIPDVDNIYKISIINFAGGNSTITINGNTSAAFTTSSASTGQDLYDFIVADATLGPAVGVDFNVYYTDFSVTIVPIAAATLTISVSNSAVLSSAIIVPANSDPIHPIGYAVLRDDIYIFSTPCYDNDPQTNGGGYGYIWKFSYNNITFAPNNTGTIIPGLANLELIYANDIDFTTWYNIPQTGVVTRYENDLIQRIYWTDNYNRVRSINVVQDQLFAMDPTLLDLVPAVDFDIPIMTDIDDAGGTAPVRPGCWQLSYRLKKNNGAVTTFSPLSNMVYITPADESGYYTGDIIWKSYRGAPQGTSLTKQVTWKINYVDLDFDSIEFVLARRSDKNDPGTFFIFEEQTLANDSVVEVTCNGDKLLDAEPLTLSEFLALSSTFTHAKTISTKDNRLVVANVKNKIGEVDFDARAYRWDNAGTPKFKIINNGSLSAALDASDYTSIAEDEDAICPFNLDPYGGGLYSTTYQYNKSGNLGGEGPNISYEFISIATAADKFTELYNCSSGPYVRTDPEFTATSLDLNVDSIDYLNNPVNQEYTLEFPSLIFENIKFPQYNSVLIGYNHNETYRFGIQFYDKTKTPFFVKWIGDIRFPDAMDPCPAANSLFTDGTQTGQTTYVRSFINLTRNNDLFTTQLGIKFNVTIPAPLTEQISGYSIVRVEREETDKQIIAEGIISNMAMLDPISSDYYIGSGNMWYNEPTTDFTKLYFISPNMLDLSLQQPSDGMRLISTTRVDQTNTTVLITSLNTDCSGVGTYGWNMYKTVSELTAGVNAFDQVISNVTLMDGIGPFTIGGNTINNQTVDGGSYGQRCYYMEVPVALNNLSGVSDADKYMVYIYIYRSEQYGGNTYAERTLNTYINCSHFRPIRTSTVDVSDSFFCYGGDVTNGYMDSMRSRVSYGGGTWRSTTFYYPANSPVNRGLRHGDCMNFTPNGGSFLAGTEWVGIETYDYNTVYSCQNNIVKYYPKPLSFNNTEIFDNRFYISEIKINGESSDSWAVFLANNYWDAEGDKGPINSMMPLNDKMYFWQDRAFGIIQINPRAVVTDVNAVNNAELQIGTGLPLQRHDYITINAGTKHQGSTIASYGKLYWYDANTFKMWVFNPGGGLQPLSDIKGFYSFFTKYLNTEIQNYDKPTCALDELTTPIGFGLNGVVAVYDNRHQRVIYTFHTSKSPNVQKSFTFTINELTDTITSFYSFTPRMYMGDGKQVFSFDETDIYVHNQGEYNNFYGVLYDSYIKFIVNPNPNLTKVFDNFVWDSQATKYVSATDSYQNYNDITFTHIRVTNDYQNTDKQALANNTDIKRKERSWQLDVPRNRVLYTSSNSPNIYTDLSGTEKTFGERMRDKYAQVELWFTNTASNYQLRLNNFITQFRQSNR